MTGLTQQGSTDKALKEFSRVLAVALPVVFGLLLPWLRETVYPVWPWLFAVLLILIGQFMPRLLVWPHKIWFKVAAILGWINSRLILGLVFFLFVTPAAVVMKMLGKSPLAGKGVLKGNSYRISSQEREDSHFEKPF